MGRFLVRIRIDDCADIDLVKQCRTCDEVGHYTKDCPEGPEQNGDGGDYDRPPRDRSADQCYKYVLA